MITHADEGPEFEPDDPLAVILRPPSDRLGPPPGRFEAIRRGAARRRLVRTVAGVGLTCAAVALVAVPLQQAATADRPTSPTVPLAPPPVSDSPSSVPRPSTSPKPAESPTAPREGTDSPSPATDGSSTPTPAPLVTDSP
ncbi:hypothetical protein GCM10010297_16340 [Streptomyces malachitofuscus]|nr:hypothetical protein GCM10010297_16340 [Streptomyces malachitofuscus]